MNTNPLTTMPVWMLLAFAAWTALVLMLTIGVYRLSRIFGGRAGMADFPAHRVEGADWYRRSMRAHANCVENLPLLGASVFGLYAAGVNEPLADWLSIAVMVARVLQSSVHIGLVQTNAVVSVRFTFFMVQLISFLILIGIVVLRATAVS